VNDALGANHCNATALQHLHSHSSAPDIFNFAFLHINLLSTQHNHGTENDPEFKHYTGNEDPKGFMNIGFVSDNLEASSYYSVSYRCFQLLSNTAKH
jgi:hypothetical protein